MSAMKTSATSSTAKAAAIALKSGVMLGGTAILSAVNGLTPHMAGAIDIMVVQQPDGSLKCSPFYVRFGKYTPMRSKDKRVHILINGEDAAISMHLGAYGQAYFAAETMEIVSDAEDEELLQGMMSPPSGYSSDEGAPYANEEILSAVQQEVQRMKAKQDTATAIAAAAVAAAVEGQSSAIEPAAGAPAAASAVATLQQHKLDAVLSDAAAANGAVSGSESDTDSSSTTSSSSVIDDISFSTVEIAAAIQQGLSDGRAAAAAPSGMLAPGAVSGLLLGNPTAKHSSRRLGKHHRRRNGPIVLNAAGDGAAEDPTRSAFQDLLLDNKYSFKVKSEDSFVADGLDVQAAAAQAQHRKARGKSRLQQEQQQHGQAGQVQPEQHTQQHEQRQQQHKHHRKPVRHVGFEVPAAPARSDGRSATDDTDSGRAKQVTQSQLASALDSTASYSVDEGFDETSFTTSRQGPTLVDSDESVTSPSAGQRRKHRLFHRQSKDRSRSRSRSSSSRSSTELQEMPTLADMAQQALQGTVPEQQSSSASHSNKDGLLASSIKAAQQQQQLGAEPQRQPEPAACEAQHPSASSSTSSCTSSSSLDQAPARSDATAVIESQIPASGIASVIQDAPHIPYASPASQQQARQAAAAAPLAALVDGTSSLEPVTPRKAADLGPAASAMDDSTTAAAPLAGTTSTAEATQPVAVPKVNGVTLVSGTLGASPPVESGYLGDSERGGPLGTSYDGVNTPTASRSRNVAAADIGSSGSGPLALGLSGFQLSLCGDMLRPDMAASEAQQVFETQRISASMWAERGVSLVADPNLVVKIGGCLYSWQAAGPMVVGLLAFGGKWDNLLGLDPTGMYPIKLAGEHSSTSKKSASSSWRLWPFTGWRDVGSSNKSAAALGGSPPVGQASSSAALGTSLDAATAPAAAAKSTLPSGGSFSNLLSLVPASAGSSSKPAPLALDKTAPGSLSAPALVGAGDGGSPQNAAGSPLRVSRKKHIIIIRKTLTPTSEQLSRLPLKPGSNTITFRASGAADLTAYIYLLRWNTRLVVSDVDGTITRSDLLGHVLPTLGVDWSHPGITQLFHNIDSNGYQIMFLSSRAIAQANITREYLHSLVQDGYKMPAGPVIISPHGLLPSLYREIVVRRPHEFKIACLQDIRALFPSDWNPFYAGFGNRDTDEVSYREVGVPLSRTFTINPKGQIQKAATAVQSSTWSSLSAINDLVHEIFPPLPAISRNGSRVLRSAQSSRRFDDLEYAAAAGIIGQDTIAAALAAQERRRSSSNVDGSAGALAAVAEEATTGNAKHTTNSATAGTTQIVADASAAGCRTAPITTPVTAASPTAEEAAASAAAAAAFAGPALEVDTVGPAREEFSDLQYWKPAFSIDIGEDLMRLERNDLKHKNQQQVQH